MIDDCEGLPDYELPLPDARRYALPRRKKPQSARKGAPTTHTRKAYASRGDDTTLSRWVKIKRGAAQLDLLATPRAVSPKLQSKPWVLAGRSKFHRKGVRAPDSAPHVLVSGHSNAKIGRDVRKGWLRGYWIYTLTLEERATCPRACHHWPTCYGNNMPFARRIDHRDPEALKAAVTADLEGLLGTRGRVGILVRLHALGDFFDPAYVQFWADALDRHPRLAVYGYTAWPPGSPIGKAITAVKARFGRRFAVRWSNGGLPSDCTLPTTGLDVPVTATVCPEQTGAAAACATCGLCWNSTRNIAFLEH